jgi:putative aminopeptidase FrvX
MPKLNMKLAKNIFSVPSLSEKEKFVLDAIRNLAEEKNWRALMDDYGNMYVQKGELQTDEKFPVLVAHVDTVHYDHLALIETGGRLHIREKNGVLRAYHPDTGMQTGIGGDDKAGVIIALEVLSRIDKGMCAFFRAEELGCIGSIQLDKDIMAQGGYAIQFDAPGNEVSVYVDGVKLYDSTFLDLIFPTLEKFKMTDFVKYNPFTDIARIRERLDYNTLNMGAGYHHYHSSTEYVVINEMEKAIACALEIVQVLGSQHYLFDELEDDLNSDAFIGGKLTCKKA